MLGAVVAVGLFIVGTPIWAAVGLGLVCGLLTYAVERRRGGGVLTDEMIKAEWGSPVFDAMSTLSFASRTEAENLLRQTRLRRPFERSYVFRDVEGRLQRDLRLMELAGWEAEVETKERDGGPAFRAAYRPRT